jgi:cathepsin B
LFQNSLSDTPNISPCKSKDDEETIIPEKYDWREQYPDCVQIAQNQGNCSSAYAMTTLSVVADRICQSAKKQVRLSTQELVSCDNSNYHCDGGYVNRVLNWGKRKGFILEQCLAYNGTKGECDEEHLETNECRANNIMYKVIDYCLAQEDIGIKKEILKNGPVVAQMTVFTDFLTYKDGVYHRTEDAFKFNGQHIVKIVGWDR